MREILFKAKRTDNGEWVEGDVSTRSIHYECLIDDGDALYEVNPKTVCQYTGLKDKNGNKIFEGDEVDCILPIEQYVRISCWVDFYKSSWRFMKNEEGLESIIDYESLDEIEITGNIHDKNKDNATT